MNYMTRLGSVILAIGSLAGCGGEDFSGAYSADGPYGKYIVLNVSDDNAKIFLLNKSTTEISAVTDFTVDYKSEKMILDSVKENIRFVFKRGVDERGLDCLNCNDMSPRFPAKWDFANAEPYDIDAMLKDQEEQRQAEVKEAEKRRAELAELVIFEGDWVAKRYTKDDSLFIMSIYPSKGVKHWAFNYQTAGKIVERDHKFEVDGKDLVIIFNDSTVRYSLSGDGKELVCTNCESEKNWFKADPVKVNDLDYARKLAGNP